MTDFETILNLARRYPDTCQVWEDESGVDIFPTGDHSEDAPCFSLDYDGVLSTRGNPEMWGLSRDDMLKILTILIVAREG